MESLDVQSKLKIENNLFITRKDTMAGTVLLTQAPLTSVPLSSERQHRCNYCLRKGKLQCCSKCHSAYFCSQDCFFKAWIHFHQDLCGKETLLEGPLALLERAALMVKNTKKINHTSMEAFLALELQPQEIISEETRSFLEKMALTSDSNSSIDQLSQLWQRIQIAQFPITDPDMHLDTVAVGIYPITSQYVRHSCRPNTGLVYRQGHQLLVALEDIPAGTCITVSYVDLMATKQQRQAALTKRFGFSYQCDCIRCQGEFQGLDVLFERGEALNVNPEELEATLESQLVSWSVLEMIKQYGSADFDNSHVALDAPHLAHFICRMILPDMYVPMFKRLGKNSPVALLYNSLLPLSQRKYTQSSELERILPAIEALLSNNASHSPFLTITGVKVAEKLLKKLIAKGKWVEASRCTIYIYMVYRLVYPALYPDMVYYSLFLARASWNSLVQLELAGMGKKLEAIYQNSVQIWIETATDAILKTFGQECALWREVVEIKWLFERDQKLKLN